MKFKPADEEAVIKYLCDEKGLAVDRIKNFFKRLKDSKGKGSQKRMDSFFNVLPKAPGSSKKRKADVS